VYEEEISKAPVSLVKHFEFVWETKKKSLTRYKKYVR